MTETNSGTREVATGRGLNSWGLLEAFVGVVLAITFMLLLVRWFSTPSFPRFVFDGNLGLLLSYLVVWVPLLGACAYACYARGTGSLGRDFGLRITWLDVLFGLGVGLLVRAVASVIEIAVYGRMNLGGATLGEIVYDGWWVFGALVAPILIAPFVEELFFRGLVLRATYRAGVSGAAGPVGRRAASVVAVIVSASTFSLLHLVEVTNAQTAIVLGLSTLILGIATGMIALYTKRIGGAMVAHATFNGSLILAALAS
jgi:membrane protease YdiL (CAAX protease family)